MHQTKIKYWETWAINHRWWRNRRADRLPNANDDDGMSVDYKSNIISYIILIEMVNLDRVTCTSNCSRPFHLIFVVSTDTRSIDFIRRELDLGSTMRMVLVVYLDRWDNALNQQSGSNTPPSILGNSLIRHSLNWLCPQDNWVTLALGSGNICLRKRIDGCRHR